MTFSLHKFVPFAEATDAAFEDEKNRQLYTEPVRPIELMAWYRW
jgi:hypothetical protein